MAIFDGFGTILQSQLVGLGKSNQAPTTNPGVSLEYGNGPGLEQIKDNVSGGAYKAQTGSMIPMFANIFNRWNGAGTVFCRAAVGGTSFLAENDQGGGNWSPTGDLFDDSVARFQAMIAAVASAGHTLRSFNIISSGGYADAKQGNNLENFKAANIALLSRYRTALSMPSLKIYQELMYAPIGSNSEQTRQNCLYIRQQMIEAAAETPGLEIAFTDSVNYTHPEMLNDDKLHYNQSGLNNMGKLFAEYIAEDMGFSDPGFPPPPAAGRTSLVASLSMFAKPKPPFPKDFGVGTTRWPVPVFTNHIRMQAEGGGGKGGNGSATLKGGAGGGGAYAELISVPVTPGQEYDITIPAANSELPVTVTRVSDGVVILRAASGKSGANGNPAVDGAGGLAADCIGDIKTPGQNGGVSGIDNGGNGAAPLGAAGGIGPGNVAGGFPGGGGAGALQGAAQVGGNGGLGLVRFTKID